MANNDKLRIDVVISGPVNCGKSTVARLVKNALELAGIETSNTDEDVERLNETVHIMPTRVKSVAKKTLVIISTTHQKHEQGTAYRGQGGQAVVPFDGRLYVSSLATDVRGGRGVWIRRIDRDGDRISVALAGSQDWGEWDAIDT